jgi:hypothetical protein
MCNIMLNNEKMKIQDGRRTPFLTSQGRDLVKCVDRFGRLIGLRQNACFEDVPFVVLER